PGRLPHPVPQDFAAAKDCFIPVRREVFFDFNEQLCVCEPDTVALGRAEEVRILFAWNLHDASTVENGSQLRSRLAKVLNGDPAASPLGGAHRLGAPYSSHRAPQRVRLRLWLRLRPCWTDFLSSLLTSYRTGV